MVLPISSLRYWKGKVVYYCEKKELCVLAVLHVGGDVRVHGCCICACADDDFGRTLDCGSAWKPRALSDETPVGGSSTSLQIVEGI